MKIISINVGQPRAVQSHGKTVTTSIFKAPVAGPVLVKRLNVVGDKQADLTVHGGADKAVYVYPSEHYAFWRKELPEVDLDWGAFGENFTTEGLLEDTIQIGDRLEIGAAEFVVTQPRLPCFKLGIRFDRPDMVKRFLASGRTGFYLRVMREGEVTANDAITVMVAADSMTIMDFVALYTADDADRVLLRRASELSALPEGWRNHFRERLDELDA